MSANGAAMAAATIVAIAQAAEDECERCPGERGIPCEHERVLCEGCRTYGGCTSCRNDARSGR